MDLYLKIIILDSKNLFWYICFRSDFGVRYDVERKDINK